MVKAYLDWNVMSGMKNNHFTELLSILKDKNKFFLPYSTSHISDIYSSFSENPDQRNVIAEDLRFISSLTENYCLINDSTNIIIDKCDPQELFDDHISEASQFKDLSLDNLFKFIEPDDHPIQNSLINLTKDFLQIPLFKDVFKDPTANELLNNFFPDLEQDPSMNGFFKSFSSFYNNLNETEKYNEVRQIVQKIGINSSHFNDDKNPFKLIEQVYKRAKIENFDPNANFKNLKTAPEWFDKITSEYLKLDMHGYKSDKIKATNKDKNTFKNITDDAFHSAFASICDYYITNDDRNYKKSKALYNELGIETKVFKPNDFIEHYKHFLEADTFIEHYKIFGKKLSEPIYYPTNNEDGSYFGRYTVINEFIFDFFNKIWIPKNDEPKNLYVVLSKSFPNNNYQCVIYTEIEQLIKQIVKTLGDDIYGNGYLNEDEYINEDAWIGRKWDTIIGTFSLIRLNGYFQLYYNYTAE